MKKNIYFDVLFILALFMCGCASGGGTAKYLRLNDQGLEAFNKKDFGAATNYFKDALNDAPNDSVIWHNLGDSYRYSLNYPEAIKAYTKSLDIDLNNVESSVGRGWAYYNTSQYNKAIVDFDRVIASQSKENLESAFDGRGYAYFRKGMYSEAIKDLSSALHINPNDGVTLQYLGWSHYYTGKFRDGIKDFTVAVTKINPDDKDNMRDILCGKALAYLGIGDHESAAALVDRALKITSINTEYLMVFYYFSGNKSKAWQLRGGEGHAGLELKNYRQGTMAGAEIIGIMKGSPSDGKFLEGDIVTAVNSRPVKTADDCRIALISVKPGSTAELNILREQVGRKVVIRINSADSEIVANQFALPLVKMKKNVSEGGEATVVKRQPVDAGKKGNSGGSKGDELQ